MNKINSFSFSVGSQRPLGRVILRLVENLTGGLNLRRQLQDFEEQMGEDDLPGALMKFYGIRLNFTHGDIHRIPATGPLVIVGNHPYGLLDSLVTAFLVSRVRPHYRGFGNHVFKNFSSIQKHVLPVYYKDTAGYKELNLQSTLSAEHYLKEQNGCIIIFPSGSVSTSRKLFGFPMDNRWKTYVCKLVVKTKATVVPIYFEGHNSRLFQIASHINYYLRTGLFVREFLRRANTEVTLGVGEPMSYDSLAHLENDKKKFVQVLYETVYGMSSRPLTLFEPDFIFKI